MVAGKPLFLRQAVLLAALVRSVLYSGISARAEAPSAPADRVTLLVEQHVSAIFRTARDLGVLERDLEDVSQEVLVVALRRLEDIEPGKERAFLLATTSRVASNYRRTRRRRPVDLHEAPDELGTELLQGSHPAGRDPELLAARGQELALAQQAVEQMTEAQRVAFILFELEELTAREIAEQLGTTETVVFARVRRARAVFRRCCSREHSGTETGGRS